MNALEMVRRMALYGTGPGTTAEQTLATIAEYAAKKTAALDAAEAELVAVREDVTRLRDWLVVQLDDIRAALIPPPPGAEEA